VALLVCLVSPPLVPAVGLELAPSSHTTCLTEMGLIQGYNTAKQHTTASE
jgi:hypothetical protein